MWYRKIITQTTRVTALALTLASCANSPATPDDHSSISATQLSPNTATNTINTGINAAKKACSVYYKAIDADNEASDKFWAEIGGSHLNFTDTQFVGGPVVNMVTMQRFWDLQIKKAMDTDLPADIEGKLTNYLNKDWDLIVSFYAGGVSPDEFKKNLLNAYTTMGKAGKSASAACRSYR